jgi:hypothetical protein
VVAGGAANEGQPQDVAPRMGVGPLHKIGESRRRQRGDGEKQAAGRDHNGAGEGSDTALATLTAEPRARESQPRGSALAEVYCSGGSSAATRSARKIRISPKLGMLVCKPRRPACERGGQTLWPDTIYGTASSRRCRGARTSVPAATTNSQSRSRSGDGECIRADATE